MGNQRQGKVQGQQTQEQSQQEQVQSHEWKQKEQNQVEEEEVNLAKEQTQEKEEIDVVKEQNQVKEEMDVAKEQEKSHKQDQEQKQEKQEQLNINLKQNHEQAQKQEKKVEHEEAGHASKQEQEHLDVDRRRNLQPIVDYSAKIEEEIENALEQELNRAKKEKSEQEKEQDENQKVNDQPANNADTKRKQNREINDIFWASQPSEQIPIQNVPQAVDEKLLTKKDPWQKQDSMNTERQSINYSQHAEDAGDSSIANHQLVRESSKSDKIASVFPIEQLKEKEQEQLNESFDIEQSNEQAQKPEQLDASSDKTESELAKATISNLSAEPELSEQQQHQQKQNPIHIEPINRLINDEQTQESSSAEAQSINDNKLTEDIVNNPTTNQLVKESSNSDQIVNVIPIEQPNNREVNESFDNIEDRSNQSKKINLSATGEPSEQQQQQQQRKPSLKYVVPIIHQLVDEVQKQELSSSAQDQPTNGIKLVDTVDNTTTNQQLFGESKKPDQIANTTTVEQPNGQEQKQEQLNESFFDKAKSESNQSSTKDELSESQRQQQRKHSPMHIKPISNQLVNDVVSEHVANNQLKVSDNAPRDPADPSEKQKQEQGPDQGDQIMIVASIDTQSDNVDPLNEQRPFDINNRVDEWIHSISNFPAEEPMQSDSQMDNHRVMEKEDGAEMLKVGLEKLIKEAISEYIQENGP